MPDIEPLFELKENLYKEGCPVLLVSGALIAGEEEMLAVQLTFRNLDDRPVTALFFDVHAFDVANNEIEVLRDKRALVPVVGRDGTFEPDVPVVLGGAAKSFSVAIKRVEFEGEDVWNGSASLLFEGVPKRRALRDVLGEDKLIEQFRRDFVGTMAENECGVAQYYPQAYKDLWLCACGGVNRRTEEKCFVCGAPLEAQCALVEDKDALAEHLAAYEKEEAEKAEQARLAAEKKAAEEKAAAEEAERLRLEAEAAAAEAARKRKLHIKIFLSVSIPLAVLIAAFLVVLFTYLLPQQRYDAALAQLENAQFEEAETAFAALEGYSDSATRVEEAVYGRGLALLEQGKYDAAVVQFERVPAYADAAEQILEAKYRKAGAAMDGGAFEDALKQFEALDGYKDTDDKIEACYFSMAKNAVENADFAHAKAYFEHVSGARNVELQGVFCAEGAALLEGDDVEGAEAYFALVTDEALLESVAAARFARGERLLADGALEEALGIFTELGTYGESEAQVRHVHFLMGEAAMDSGDYAKAIEEFTAAGDWENAASRLVDATYAYGVQLLNNGQAVDSYNVLYPIRSDDRAFALLVSDSQYYIYVYDVGVGPNPLNEA